MNIKQAKDEITRAINAYLATDDMGEPVIARVRQRPILLMGAPGIGKTAIMEQVARECGVALVSYSITHHTRQSAIGLPFISHKTYDEKEYAVTEYTMSEIIASVYDKIEETGLKNGILFIDEINCASETLAPAMLQFLQAKTFGAHAVPKNWMIVAAGNPPEYNKSVRDFDIVTLDRVKKIDVSPDFLVWKEYAYKQGVHGAILSYLEIKKNYFYVMKTTVDGKSFVTARGWEDLSNIIRVYEQMGEEINEDLAFQYLQHQEIAKDFANYYDLYQKYKTDYRIADIVAGQYSEAAVEKLQKAPFHERLSVLGLLLSQLNEGFKETYEADLFVTALHGVLGELKERFNSPYCEATPWDSLYGALYEENKSMFQSKKTAGLLDKNQVRALQRMQNWLEEMEQDIKKSGISEKSTVFDMVRDAFQREVGTYQDLIEGASAQLSNTFGFLENCFGVGQEMVIFITELTSNYYSVKFISENGSEQYYRYNAELLFDEKEKSILQDIEAAKAGEGRLF